MHIPRKFRSSRKPSRYDQWPLDPGRDSRFLQGAISIICVNSFLFFMFLLSKTPISNPPAYPNESTTSPTYMNFCRNHNTRARAM